MSCPSPLAGDFCQFFNTAVDQISQLMQYRQMLGLPSFGPHRSDKARQFLQRGFNIRVRVRMLFNISIIGRIHCSLQAISHALLLSSLRCRKMPLRTISGRDGRRYR